MIELKLTPEEYAEMMAKNKPHLIALEEQFERLQFGEVEVKFTVRSGVITKMVFFESRTWLKDKANP